MIYCSKLKTPIIFVMIPFLSSLQAQVAAISKFLTTARLCQEMRNFATCISILDGLENVLVRQVPVSAVRTISPGA